MFLLSNNWDSEQHISLSITNAIIDLHARIPHIAPWLHAEQKPWEKPFSLPSPRVCIRDPPGPDVSDMIIMRTAWTKSNIREKMAEKIV